MLNCFFLTILMITFQVLSHLKSFTTNTPTRTHFAPTIPRGFAPLLHLDYRTHLCDHTFARTHFNTLRYVEIKVPFFYCSAGRNDKSIELMGSAISSHLLLECIGHLANLARLALHALATNIMLYSIAETCTKLQVLDISFSSEVTDLGLLYLSGGSGRCER